MARFARKRRRQAARHGFEDILRDDCPLCRKLRESGADVVWLDDDDVDGFAPVFSLDEDGQLVLVGWEPVCGSSEDTAS